MTISDESDYQVHEWEWGTGSLTAPAVDPLTAEVRAIFAHTAVPEWAESDYVSWSLSFPCGSGVFRMASSGLDRDAIRDSMRLGVRWAEAADANSTYSPNQYLSGRSAGATHAELMLAAERFAPEVYILARVNGASHAEVCNHAATGLQLAPYARARQTISHGDLVAFRSTASAMNDTRRYVGARAAGATHDQIMSVAAIKRVDLLDYVAGLELGIPAEHLLEVARKPMARLNDYVKAMRAQVETHASYIARHSARRSR